MKLEHSFARTEATFGTDAAPTNAAYLTNDNVFNAPQYGVFSEPISSIAVAFDGPAGASDADVVFYLWDEESETWYQFATETIPLSEIHFVPLPNIVDRKNSRQASRISVAIVAGPSTAAPAGAYVVSSSSSTSQNIAGSIGVLLTSAVTLLTNIDTNTAPGQLTPRPVIAAGDEAVIIAEGARIGKVLVVNSSDADTWYLQLFDSATVPADAALPDFVSSPVPPNTMLEFYLDEVFVSGVSWAASNTVDDKHVENTALFQVQVEIK